MVEKAEHNIKKTLIAIKNNQKLVIIIIALFYVLLTGIKVSNVFSEAANAHFNWLFLLPILVVSIGFSPRWGFVCTISSIVLGLVGVDLITYPSFNLYFYLFMQAIVFLLVGIIVNILIDRISVLQETLRNYEYAYMRELSYQEEIIETLLKSVNAKDSYTYKHSQRVAYYSKKLAMNAGLSTDDVNRIYIAAKLHDIGKIGMRDSILNKAAKLDDAEYMKAKNHVIVGADIVNNMENLQDIVPVIKHHHERYDGKGYPDGLKGDEIPFGSKVIAICDAFDAMTSDRDYHKGIESGKAVEILMDNIGTQFDPELCILFADIISIKSNLHPDIIKR